MTRPIVTEFPDVGITMVSWWIFNAYLVDDGGAGVPLVVDAGIPQHGPWIDRWMRDRGHRRAVVVATHGHVDHVGGIPGLAARQDIEIGLPERVQRYVAGERPRQPGLRAVARIRPVFAEQPRCLAVLPSIVGASRRIGIHGGGCRLPLSCDHWLSDGGEVPGAPEWSIVAAAGHSDDSLAFVRERDGVMCSGDAVLSRGGRGWFTPELVDEALATATEERLRRIDVSYLLPGHGRAVVGTNLLGAAASPEWTP